MPTSWPAVYPTSACDPLPSEALVADRTPERPARRLLDRVRDAIRAKHYSRATETAYLGWIRRVILFHGKRQPAEMGEAEIAAYLTHLVTARRVSAQRAVREAALEVQIIKLERPNLRRNMAYG